MKTLLANESKIQITWEPNLPTNNKSDIKTKDLPKYEVVCLKVLRFTRKCDSYKKLSPIIYIKSNLLKSVIT